MLNKTQIEATLTKQMRSGDGAAEVHGEETASAMLLWGEGKKNRRRGGE